MFFSGSTRTCTDYGVGYLGPYCLHSATFLQECVEKSMNAPAMLCTVIQV